MLNEGFSPNTLDGYQRSGLMRAVLAKNYDAIDVLIRAGIDVNLTNRYNTTALSLVLRQSFFEQPQLRLAIVKKLLAAGGDSNIKDEASAPGNSPFTYAIAYGQLECAREMVHAGANINSQNTRGETALMLAVDNDYLHCVSFLLDQQADLNMISTDGKSAVSRAQLRGGAILDLITAYQEKQSLDHLIMDNHDDDSLTFI